MNTSTTFMGGRDGLQFSFIKLFGRSASCMKINPGSYLSDFVDYLWLLNLPQKEEKYNFDRYIPNGGFELIFNLGDPVFQSLGTRQWIMRPEITLFGSNEKFVLINPSGKISVVGVVFKPGKINAFLKNFSHKNVSLQFIPKQYLFMDPGPVLARLKKEESKIQKLRIVHTYLEKCLNRHDHSLSFIDYATSRILISKGDISIQDISKSINCSERHLNRKFKERFGISPKKFTQIVKINSIIHELMKGHKKLAELAYEHGFFDQTHLNKTFKSIVGVTPKKFLKEMPYYTQYVYVKQNELLQSA